MQKYILYSFLAIFAFSPASFGVKEDKEDSSNMSKIGVSKIGVKETPLKIDWDALTKEGRLGGLSPQIHLSPDKKYPSDSPYSRGKTIYIPRNDI